MAKSHIKSLNFADFLKAGEKRENIIAKAPAKPVPPTSSYRANRIASALHPERQSLIVSKIDEIADGVKSIHLVGNVKKGTEKVAYFSAGQYLVLFLDINGAKITRPYSISSSPKQALDGEYVLTIKRVNGGLASNFILDAFEVGTEVEASAPEGEFTYEPLRDAKNVVALAGGSGITPFLSLAKAIENGDEDCSLTLIYGARTEKEILFKDTFDRIADTCNKVNVIYVLSDERNDKYENGFITADLISKHAPEGDYSVFICGPQAMYDFVDKELAKLNLRKKFIRHETFGEYRNPQKDADYPYGGISEVKITAIIRDEKYEITASTNDTILNSLEKNGIAVPSRCRSGVCGWCHSKLVDGTVYIPKSVDGRRLADYDYGYIHPCCSFPLSDVTLIASVSK